MGYYKSKQIKQNIVGCIERHGLLRDGENILVGVSGGPDSVALIRMLAELAPDYGISLAMVYVHHHLRAEADGERDLVQSLAEALGIPFYTEDCDIMGYAKIHGCSEEEAGHWLRREIFRRLGDEIGADKLALGHHQNDRAETVIQHMLRGCGLDGLATMPAQSGWIIRPLSDVKKADLIALCDAEGWQYAIDASNGDLKYQRNRIRVELIPLLEQAYQPEIVSHLAQLAESATLDEEYLRAQTEDVWERHGLLQNGMAEFPTETYRALPPALQRRMIRYMAERCSEESLVLSFAQLAQIDGCLKKEQGEKRLFLGQGFQFVKQYDKIFIGKSAPKGDREWTVEVDILCLPEQLTVRGRKVGDRIARKGMGRGKLLKDFFMEQKVPASLRDDWPVVVDGKTDEILWIPDLYLHTSLQITTETEEKVRLLCRDNSALSRMEIEVITREV